MNLVGIYYVIGAGRDRQCQHAADGKTKVKSDFLSVIQNGNHFWISRYPAFVYNPQFISEYKYS